MAKERKSKGLNYFGKYIAKICIDLGINRSRLVKEIGISEGYITKVTNGDGAPSDALVEKLGKYLSKYPDAYNKEELIEAADAVRKKLDISHLTPEQRIQICLLVRLMSKKLMTCSVSIGDFE